MSERGVSSLQAAASAAGRPRVCWVVGRFPAAAETFVLRQIIGLIERGVDVTILAMERGGGDAVHGAIDEHRLMERVHYAPAVPGGLFRRVLMALLIADGRGYRGWRLLGKTLSRRRFGRRARTLRPFFEALPWLDPAAPGWVSLGPPAEFDVVLATYGTLGRALVELREMGLWRGALVTFFRGYDATRTPRREPGCYDRLFRAGECFLPVCDDLRDELVGLGCPPGKARTLRGGVELGALASCPPPTRGEGGPGEPTRLVSVCRLVPKKGLAEALSAVAEAVGQGRAVRYQIVGEGPMRGELEAEVKRLGLGGVVELVGWRSQEQVWEILRGSHVLLAPSVTPADGNREGIPNAIKEAMACARPVLATRHGGIGELVEDQATGYLVDEHDPAALAERLLELIDHPERWAEMGARGRARVTALHDLGRLNDELAGIVRELAR